MRSILFLLLFFLMNSCYAQRIEGNIVLINIGDYDRGGIADVISKVNELNPKVISLDVAFRGYTGSKEDKRLYSALNKVSTLVLPAEISYEGKDYHGREMINVYLSCAAPFIVPYSKFGFVNAEKEEGIDRPQIPRQFIVWQKGSASGDIYHHFSVVTAMAFDSLKASSFVQDHERLVDVDYKDGKRRFKTFPAFDVLKDKLTKTDIDGKIVMLGFLGPGEEDKFFTQGSLKPDMYGLEYLANIVAQILEK